MCLSIPARIITIDGDTAEVSAGGSIFRAGIQMIDNPAAGDYILVHAGFAIQKLKPDEAEDILNLFDEMGKII